MAGRLAMSVLATLCLAGPAQAFTILYEVNDLGGDRWEYQYLVSGGVFEPDQGFSVYFDPGLYHDLEVGPASGDWDVLVVQPDPGLPSDGFYDALALVPAASLAEPFVVRLLWLGSPVQGPGAQPFTINQFETDGSLTILASGLTQPTTKPIPEPATWLLFGAGVSGLVRRARASRAR